MKVPVLLGLALVISLVISQKFYAQIQEQKREIERLKSENRALDRDLISARGQKEQQIEVELSTLKDLEAKIGQKTTELSDLQNQAKAFNDSDLGGNNPQDVQWDIKHEKEVIADLERRLKDLQAQEGLLKSESTYLQNVDKRSKAQSESELQTQIQVQQENLHELEGRLNQARRDRSAYEVVEKLQDQVSQQSKFVNQLKIQKQTLGKQWDLVSAQHGNVYPTLSQIKSQEAGIQNQLAKEKSHEKDLENESRDYKNAALDHSSRWNRLQKSIQNDKDEITRLQNEKNDHQLKLKALNPGT